jgi:hypothetical protein
MIPVREDLDHPGMFVDRSHPLRRAIEECRPVGLATACRSTHHLLMRWWTDMS